MYASKDSSLNALSNYIATVSYSTVKSSLNCHKMTNFQVALTDDHLQFCRHRSSIFIIMQYLYIFACHDEQNGSQGFFYDKA